MTQKITIRRHPDGWHVTRPAFGFASEPSVTAYPSWTAAVKALDVETGSGAQLTERNVRGYTPGLPSRKWGQEIRPRWIET